MLAPPSSAAARETACQVQKYLRPETVGENERNYPEKKFCFMKKQRNDLHCK